MDRKRPDFPEYMRWLGLTPEASQLDILSRSGEQKGDSVYLAEAPAVADDGATEAVFLARGASYAVRQYGTEATANSLRAGDYLVLVDDDTNEANPQALLLKTRDGAAVGWMPDLLIDYARQVRAGAAPWSCYRTTAASHPRATARADLGSDNTRNGNVYRGRVAVA